MENMDCIAKLPTANGGKKTDAFLCIHCNPKYIAKHVYIYVHWVRTTSLIIFIFGEASLLVNKD